uniref:Uncharacterized protein n=1 Tax=Alexandrium catenella TaxID=2925 RepID=A0A7S1MIP4_ALECA
MAQARGFRTFSAADAPWREAGSMAPSGENRRFAYQGPCCALNTLALVVFTMDARLGPEFNYPANITVLTVSAAIAGILVLLVLQPAEVEWLPCVGGLLAAPLHFRDHLLSGQSFVLKVVHLLWIAYLVCGSCSRLTVGGSFLPYEYLTLCVVCLLVGVFLVVEGFMSPGKAEKQE